MEQVNTTNLIAVALAMALAAAIPALRSNSVDDLDYKAHQSQARRA